MEDSGRGCISIGKSAGSANNAGIFFINPDIDNEALIYSVRPEPVEGFVG